MMRIMTTFHAHPSLLTFHVIDRTAPIVAAAIANKGNDGN